MASGPSGEDDLERVRRLAADLAGSDPGPAGELACALADAVAGIAGRVDALWQLITSVVQAAELSGPAPAAGPPPAEFVRAVTAPRRAGTRGVRLSIDGKQWVAAISQDQPPADPAGAWAALERLTRAADDAGQADG
jgi:hypothetical protein